MTSNETKTGSGSGVEIDRDYLRLQVRQYYGFQDERIRAEHRIKRYTVTRAINECNHECGTVSPSRQLRPEERESAAKKACMDKSGADRWISHMEKARSDVESLGWYTEVVKRTKSSEDFLKREILKTLDEMPIWNEWLSKIRGIGPCLAGGFVAEIHPENCTHVSQLYRWCGQGVTVQGFKCFQCGSDVPYEGNYHAGNKSPLLTPCKCGGKFVAIGQAERRVKGEKLHYVPFLKVHCYKMGQSFLKTGGKYRELYDQFRKTVNSRPCTKVHTFGGKIIAKPPDCIDAHRMFKALRMVTKVFLTHYYTVSRVLLGLPVTMPFQFGLLGHDPSGLIEPLVDEGEVPGKVLQVIRAWRSSR